MDKFEKLIKQSVEGYEAPFNPQAWENVSKELPDSFDHMMKDSASTYEAPYNPAAWDAVSSQLGPATAAWKWIAGAAAVIAVVAGSVYLFNTTQQNSTQTSQNNSSEVVVNDIDKNENNEVVTISDADNQSETSSDDVTVEENGQEVIHHIPNDLTVEIDPIDVEDDSNGQDTKEETENSGGTVQGSTEDTNVTDNGSLNDDDGTHMNEVHVNPGFVVSETEICKNGYCTFTPELIVNELMYAWNFGDGSISSSKSPKHKFTKAGEFNVTLEVRHPGTGKTLASSSETVVVNELPDVDFKWEKSNEAIPTITFINKTEGSVKSAWNIKGLKESHRNEFDYTFRKAGNYFVSLTAENEYGCESSVEKKVSIENDYNLLAPNAFNPNGDGNNDYFIPKALKMMNVEFTMTIYDKPGNLVYRTQNAFEPWDGRYTEENKMAEDGSSFIWVVVLTNNNGEEEVYKGQVFVIR
jgi:gliding motility-associated-like protein